VSEWPAAKARRVRAALLEETAQAVRITTNELYDVEVSLPPSPDGV
jgi:hypothetical protein